MQSLSGRALIQLQRLLDSRLAGRILCLALAVEIRMISGWVGRRLDYRSRAGFQSQRSNGAGATRGSRIPASELTHLAGPRQVPAPGPLGACIVVLQECTACAENLLTAVNAVVAQHPTLAASVVVQKPPSEGQTAERAFPRLSFFLDPTGDAQRVLAGNWPARVLIVDRNSRVVYVEPPGATQLDVLTFLRRYVTDHEQE